MPRAILLLLAALLAAPLALADDVDGDESRHAEESSPLLAKGESWSRTFANGTHEYHCHPHPHMKGVVKVSSEEGAPKNATVVIRNDTFEPAEVVVRPGGTVTWVNEDDVAHTATFGDAGHGSHHHHMPAPGPVLVVLAAVLGVLLVRRR